MHNYQIEQNIQIGKKDPFLPINLRTYHAQAGLSCFWSKT